MENKNDMDVRICTKCNVNMSSMGSPEVENGLGEEREYVCNRCQVRTRKRELESYLKMHLAGRGTNGALERKILNMTMGLGMEEEETMHPSLTPHSTDIRENGLWGGAEGELLKKRESIIEKKATLFSSYPGLENNEFFKFDMGLCRGHEDKLPDSIDNMMLSEILPVQEIKGAEKKLLKYLKVH